MNCERCGVKIEDRYYIVGKESICNDCYNKACYPNIGEFITKSVEKQYIDAFTNSLFNREYIRYAEKAKRLLDSNLKLAIEMRDQSEHDSADWHFFEGKRNVISAILLELENV